MFKTNKRPEIKNLPFSGHPRLEYQPHVSALRKTWYQIYKICPFQSTLGTPRNNWNTYNQESKKHMNIKYSGKAENDAWSVSGIYILVFEEAELSRKHVMGKRLDHGMGWVDWNGPLYQSHTNACSWFMGLHIASFPYWTFVPTDLQTDSFQYWTFVHTDLHIVSLPYLKFHTKPSDCLIVTHTFILSYFQIEHLFTQATRLSHCHIEHSFT